jgi:hypothetical protein
MLYLSALNLRDESNRAHELSFPFCPAQAFPGCCEQTGHDPAGCLSFLRLVY